MRSLWSKVHERLESIDVEFDPWQQGFATITLGIGADGKFVASVGGVVVSIPRQVGKTFTIGHLLIALCLVIPRLRVIWTSHHATTTDNTFQSMQALVLRKKVLPLLAGKPRTANGQQRIVFKNGSRIMFGAREHGFGRGMDAIDVLVLDEAQKLSLKALEDMVPSTNQARNPYGALVFFAGTPPRPTDNGEAFTSLRRSALEGESPSRIYVELSADPDAEWDDRDQWRKMNPSYPRRTPEESMLRMRALIPDPDSWRREAMGIWDETTDDEIPTAIDLDRWASLVADPPTEGVPTFGVKFSTDGETVALAGASRPEIGPVHVEGIDHRHIVEGTGWLLDFLMARKARVVIDGRGGSGALALALRQAGMPSSRIIRPSVDEAIAAHAGFVEAVRAGDLTHHDDAALDDAAAAAVRRPIGTQGGWGFRGMTGDDDVSLIEAAVLAHWGAMRKKKPRRGTDRGRRRAIVPA